MTAINKTPVKIAILTFAAFTAAGLAAAAPKADLDQNGEVSQAEFMAAATSRFAAIDTNADDVLTSEEMKAARKAKADAKASERFGALDANADGVVSKSEYDQKRADRAEKRKARMDVNGDGVVDSADRDAAKAAREARKAERAERHAQSGERAGKPQGKRGAKKRGPNHDSNGDGVITRAEYEASTLMMFERLDANSDGVLTQGEGRRKKGKKMRRRSAGQ